MGPLPAAALARLDAVARGLVGTPFRHGGRDPVRGLDCWGLVRHVYAEAVGLELPALELDGRPEHRPACTALSAAWRQGGDWREVAAARARPGDGVLLLLDGLPIHCGVVLTPGPGGGRRFVHADHPVGVVIERLDGIRWRDRVVGYFRPVGLT